METVDDLVRDLAVEDGTSPFPYAVAGEREPDRLRLLAAAWQPVANGATSRIVRVRGRVFTVAVVLIFATCVFLLLAWLFSKQ